jgi:Tfp pilus assembly protein PilF
MNSHAQLLDQALGHHRAGRLAQAEPLYREILAGDPTHSDAWHLLGLLAHQTGNHQAAGELISRAIAANGAVATYYNSLGEVLRVMGIHHQAIAAYEDALRQDPSFAEAHNNMGTVYQNEGQFAKALACYERAMALNPGYANAHYNRARTWLSQGDYVRGWAEYEWRWQRGEFLRPKYAQPQWDGAPLAGRTLLVTAEQGLGDTLQFVRYVPLLAQAGGRIVLEVQPSLLPLLCASGYANLLGQREPLPAFDTHIALLSVPRVLCTTLETIPRNVPYLAADPKLLAAWRQEVAGLEGFRVGIHWQGNPQSPLEPWRSMPLASFEPLARVRGVRLVSLQKGAALEGRFEVVDLSRKLDVAHGPFMDTAALVSALDLVITSDSAVAHLAGALGVEVWVALPVSADWRWLWEREDCPWYPTMRLFRQRKLGQWYDVFERIAAALAQRATSPQV